jgi:predicted secreted protein
LAARALRFALCQKSDALQWGASQKTIVVMPSFGNRRYHARMIRAKQFLVGAAICLFAATSTPSVAADQPYDQVDLSASAEQEIDNDLLIAVVYAEAQDERQADAANVVNEAIQWALSAADRARGVKTQTLQYSSFPTYGNNSRIVGWQARQSLRLESADSDALGKLLGELQERVAIQSVNYDVSREARARADDALIAEALAQFNRRATLVAEQLGRPGFRIVRMSISTGSNMPSPIAYRSRGVAAMEAGVAAPALDSGVQTLSVTVSGTIELDAPR